MATKKKAAAASKATKDTKKTTGQGSAVVLPNGQRRIDFIRDRYYKNGKHTDAEPKRGAIKTEINDMLEKAGRKDEAIPYQIVFAATKPDIDPRTVAKETKADKKEPVKGGKK